MQGASERGSEAYTGTLSFGASGNTADRPRNSFAGASDEASRAMACAVRALARRDHSVAEIERKLRDRGVSPATIAEVIARLTRSGYLDDRRFAERWAESAVTNGRGYGLRLRQELVRRGVPREIVAEVLAAVAACHGEEETLAALVDRKFAGFDPGSAPDREKRRVFSWLQRRGFSMAAIFAFFGRNW